MAETNKQLVLVVENTADMGPYWQSILGDYLYKIIRSFCGNDDTVAANDNVELGLVVFNANKSSIYNMSQRYGLTTEMNGLFGWLTSINFISSNRGVNAKIDDGLNAALMLFDSTNVSQNRHCILVTATDPHPLVYKQSDKNETVAKSFSESGISLSVICPKRYPTLIEIYNEGKENRSATDHTIVNDEYPQYLVLISENLMKDCADLRQSGIITILQNPLTRRDPVIWNWKPLSVGNSPLETVQAVGPSSQTSDYIPFGSTQESVLNNLSRLGRLQIPIGIPRIGERSVGGYSYVSGSSSITMSQPLYGFNDARQSIPVTRTMIPPPLLMTPEQLLSQPPYYKVWEGDLFWLKDGHPVFGDRLEGYLFSPCSRSIAADWPPKMLIESLISLDYMNNKEIVGNADIFFFRSRNMPSLVRRLKETKNCAVIRLPTKVLVLVPISDQPDQIFGWLCNYRPPSPPQQYQQQGRVSL